MSWEMRFRETDWGRAVDVALVEVNSQGEVTHIAKPVQFEMVPINHGALSAPTFSIPFGVKFLEKLATNLAEHGVKPHSESKREGIILAMTEHLRDLRTILKLPSKGVWKQ